MRTLVGAVAVLGALSIAGVPAVAFTLAQAEPGSSPTAPGAAADKDPGGGAVGGAVGGDKPGNGPPAHANSRHNDPLDGPRKDRAGKDGARKDGAGSGPDRGPRRDKANEHAEQMSSLGRAHGKAMRAWAACVVEHAGDRSDPEAACGQRPTPPGHLKRDLERDLERDG